MTAIKLTINWVKEIEKAYKLPEKLITIIPTFYEKNTVSSVVMENLKLKYGDLLADTCTGVGYADFDPLPGDLLMTCRAFMGDMAQSVQADG